MQYLTIFLALVLVLFFIVGGGYNIYLSYLEFGVQYLLPHVWWLSSVLILGTVATLGGRKPVLGYYLGDMLEPWKDYNVSWLVWFVWQTFKVLLFGWLLCSTFFSMGLHAGFSGMEMNRQATLLLMGPLLTAVVVRIILFIIGELPGITTDRLFVLKFLTVLALFLAIYSLKSTSPITDFKVQIFMGLFIVGLTLLGMGQSSMAPFLALFVFLSLIGPVVYEQFITWPIVDPNMIISGLQTLETRSIEGGRFNKTRVTELKEDAEFVRNWDLETAAGKLQGVKLENYEKFGKAQVWFGETQEYWVIPQLLADGPPVASDWESMHLTYTRSVGITMINPKTGELMDSEQFFPQQAIVFGTGGGYKNWIIGPLGGEAGIDVDKTAQLFDWELGEYLPGRLIRFKEVSERLSLIFPYLITGEPQLVTGEKKTYYSVSLIAEITGGWVPGAEIPYLQEIGKALVNTRTGKIRLIKVGKDPVGKIIQNFYNFEDAPLWFKPQRKYPKTLFLKQLRVLDLYFPTPLSMPDSIQPEYLHLSSGPALVMPIKSVISKEIIGYIQIECGEDYGKIYLYRFKKHVHHPTDVKERISNSMHRIPGIGTELGTYVTTGRPTLGKPTFYPLLERGYYFTPMYIKQEKRKLLKYVVVMDAETGALGVGKDAVNAVEDLAS